MREELAARPLVLVFVAFVSGLGCGFSWWSLVGLVVILGLIWGEKRWGLVVLGIAAGLSGFLARPEPGAMMWEPARGVSGEVRMLTIPDLTDAGASGLGIWEGQRVRVRFSEDVRLVPGDTLDVSGELRPLPEGVGFSGGATAALVLDDWRMVRPGWSFLRPGLALRDSFRGFVGRTMDERAAAFVKAVCFGDTSQLEGEEWDAFQLAGTTHVVSTSGLHATVTAGVVFWLVGLIPVGRVWRLVALLFGVLLYASAAGFEPPIVRAGIMVMAWQGAYLFRREPDGLSALALAGLVNLVFDPFVVGSVGFWLSTVAMGGLVMFVNYEPGEAWWKTGVFGSWVATVGTAPIVASVFGRLSVVGILANLVIVPVVSLVVILSLAGWGMGLIWEPLGAGVMVLVVRPLVWFCAWATGVFAGLPWAMVEAPYLPLWLVVFLTVCLAMLWRPYVRAA